MRFAKICLTGVISSALTATVSACPECRAKVGTGIYNYDFATNLLFILLPILILTAIGIGLYFADEFTDKIKAEIDEWQTKKDAAR